MPDDFSFREQPFQNNQQFLNSLKLQRIQGVARLALLIQTTLIADADRASIIRSGMSTNFQQLAVLRHRAILSDVEVIADIIKTTCLMVPSHLFYRIVLVTTSSTAVQHEKSHRVGRHHVFAVLNSGEECTL